MKIVSTLRGSKVYWRGFPDGSLVKNLPDKQEAWVQSLGLTAVPSLTAWWVWHSVRKDTIGVETENLRRKCERSLTIYEPLLQSPLSSGPFPEAPGFGKHISRCSQAWMLPSVKGILRSGTADAQGWMLWADGPGSLAALLLPPPCCPGAGGDWGLGTPGALSGQWGWVCVCLSVCTYVYEDAPV